MASPHPSRSQGRAVQFRHDTATRFVTGVEPIRTKLRTTEISIGTWALDVVGNSVSDGESMRLEMTTLLNQLMADTDLIYKEGSELPYLWRPRRVIGRTMLTK